MPFTVEDFTDLIRLLRERPEWQAELRRLVLPEELLPLPALVRDLAQKVGELAEAQRRTEERQARAEEQIAALAEAQRQTEAELRELARLQAAMLKDIDVLKTDVAVLRIDVAQLKTDVAQLKGDVGHLKGDNLERRYRERAGAYFDDLVRRARVLSTEALADLLDEAVEAGRLTPAERKDLLAADLVVRGRRRDDGTEVFLVVEISTGSGLEGVARAARRAQALSKVEPTLAVVAGAWLTPEAEEAVKSARIISILDGRAQQVAS
jgi:polyhydroxyalkanoate synthesis regulator phasin